jgi:hypothetical protein
MQGPCVDDSDALGASSDDYEKIKFVLDYSKFLIGIIISIFIIIIIVFSPSALGETPLDIEKATLLVIEKAKLKLEDNKFKLEGAKLEYEKVKTLFDYTKFHIGIYLTLGTILVAVLDVGTKMSPYQSRFTVRKWPLILAIIFILFAGFAGGVIASTLPEYESVGLFFESKVGFWVMELLDIEILSGRDWTRIEHTAFWIGIFWGLVAFFPRNDADC